MTSYSLRCGKNRHIHESHAIRSAIASSRRGGLALRVYRCPGCKGWHLTKRRDWQEAPAPEPRVEPRLANGHRQSCPCGQCAWLGDPVDAEAERMAAA